MKVQISKWGKDLALRIPEPVAKNLGLEEGIELDLTFQQGNLVLRPRRRTYTLAELVAGITDENRPGETDWGTPVGREV
jgi:antitoxin MazE